MARRKLRTVLAALKENLEEARELATTPKKRAALKRGIDAIKKVNKVADECCAPGQWAPPPEGRRGRRRGRSRRRGSRRKVR